MTTYNFTDGSVARHPIAQESTPGDLNGITVRRGIVNSAIQNLANADVAQVVKINAGEIVLDVWARMITAESTANCDCNLGFGGGAEVGDELVTADSAANTVFHNATFAPIHFNAANMITLSPNNAVTMDTGVVEICALITKSFDKF